MEEFNLVEEITVDAAITSVARYFENEKAEIINLTRFWVRCESGLKQRSQSLRKSTLKTDVASSAVGCSFNRDC